MNLPQEVEKRCNDALTSSIPWIAGDGVDQVLVSARVAHGLMESLGKEQSQPIQQESNQLTDVVGTMETALADADLELERTAANAEWSEDELGKVVELRKEIETANDELVEIRAVMEAMGP